MTLKPQFSVCVYCGSRLGDSPAFAEAARALGEGIATRGWRLVYGAGDVGLMGEVARAAQSAGAYTLGVIPEHLQSREVGKSDLSAFIVTETMHERKKIMFMNADAVVALPGGLGSLDELFEVLTWRQLGLHAKPAFLLDIESYWRPLTDLLDHVVERGFAGERVREFLQTATSVDDLLSALSDHAPA